MSSRQSYKTTDLLRLEVEGNWTGLPNLVPNPSGEGGIWGWGKASSSTILAALAGPVFQFTRGGVAGLVANTDLIPIRYQVAGVTQQIRARILRGALVGTGNVATVRVDFYNKDKTFHSSTAAVTMSASAYFEVPATNVPSAATRYCRVVVAMSSATAGHSVRFSEVTLVNGSPGNVAASTPVAEPNWTSILSPAISVTVDREGLNLGTLAATIRDATLDPATSSTIRKGRRIRLSAKTPGAVWERLFTGTIDTADVSYDLLYPVPNKRARITITAVDPVATLAGTPRPSGVATIPELPAVLEDAGVPWNVNGSTGMAAGTVVAVDKAASALDQIAITRDSASGFAWVSRTGILNAWDRGTISATLAATFTETTYTDLQVGFNASDCINDVTVIARSIVGGETIETTYGPFTDGPSVKEWGTCHVDVTVQGSTWNSTTAEAFADAIFAAAATPRIRVNSLKFTIADAADITSSRALLDLYDAVKVTNTAKAIDQTLRPTRIVHQIDSDPAKWTVSVEFEEAAGVASPSLPAARAGTAGLTVTDGVWVPVAFGPTFSNYGSGFEACEVTRLNGIVYWRGLANSAAVRAAGSVIVQAPPGYRKGGGPAHVSVGMNGVFGLVLVSADGTVAHNAGPTSGWVSLASIPPYPAEA